MRSRIPAVVTAFIALALPSASAVRADVRVSLQAGLNESKATLNPDPGLPEPGYRPAWSAGVTFELPAGRRLSVATGLRYIQYGERLSVAIVSTGGGARFERRLVWHYVAVPVQARLHLPGLRGLYLVAGGETALLATVSYQDRVTSDYGPILSRAAAPVRPAGQIFEDAGSFFADPRGAYTPWNLAISGGLGCDFPLARHTGLVEARYTHGLVDIARSRTLERATRGFELLLGARW